MTRPRKPVSTGLEHLSPELRASAHAWRIELEGVQKGVIEELSGLVTEAYPGCPPHISLAFMPKEDQVVFEGLLRASGRTASHITESRI